ncbi:hypothetical protein KPATCC21470_2752 [Kitasatospora purpeofusca]
MVDSGARAALPDRRRNGRPARVGRHALTFGVRRVAGPASPGGGQI